jgi:hypothetical protein
MMDKKDHIIANAGINEDLLNGNMFNKDLLQKIIKDAPSFQADLKTEEAKAQAKE